MHVAAVGAVEAVVGGGVEVGRGVPAEGDGAAEPLEAGGEGEGEGLRRARGQRLTLQGGVGGDGAARRRRRRRPEPDVNLL